MLGGNVCIGLSDLANDCLGLESVCGLCPGQDADCSLLQLRSIGQKAAHDRAIVGRDHVIDHRAERILGQGHHVLGLANELRRRRQGAAYHATEPVHIHARNLCCIDDRSGALGNVGDCRRNHSLLWRDAVNLAQPVAVELDVEIRVLRHEALGQTNALVAICNEQAAVCVFVDSHNAGELRIPFGDELQTIGYAELIAAALELERARIDHDITRIEGIENAAQVIHLGLGPGQDLGRQSLWRAINQIIWYLAIRYIKNGGVYKFGMFCWWQSRIEGSIFIHNSCQINGSAGF